MFIEDKYMKYRVILVSCEDVDDRSSRLWSGTTFYCSEAIKKQFEVIGAKIGYPWVKERGDMEKRYLGGKADFSLLLASYDPEGKHRPFAIYVDDASQPPESYKRVIYTRKTFDHALVIFAFSDFERKMIIDDYGITPSKVVTVGAGPNLRRLPSINNKEFDGKTILFVGSDMSRKGGLVLLEAFKKVKEMISNARLIIISSDAYIYSKERELRHFGIIIKNFVSKQTLGHWYRCASVFVMPSFYEPFGIVFLEAMAYKLPCIGTNVCAMPEIIDDAKTGFVVRPGDANELAEKIIYLLRHKMVSKHMGELGRKKVEQYYLWDRVAQRMEKHVESVLKKRKY